MALTTERECTIQPLSYELGVLRGVLVSDNLDVNEIVSTFDNLSALIGPHPGDGIFEE